jgi:DNA polymerase III epsilon subunit family exonuclease
MPSLLDKLFDVPLTFVDVETTGACPGYGDRVTEIGILRIERGERVTAYQQLVDPQRRIGFHITRLTAITQQMVDGQPRFADVLPRVVELLSGTVVVGHNVGFDLGFLEAEFRHCRECMHESLTGCRHVLDTVRIARRRFGRGGNALGRLARRLGVQPDGAHRALADAITTSMIFHRLMEPQGGWSICLCDAIVQQGGPIQLPGAGTRQRAKVDLPDPVFDNPLHPASGLID